MFGRIARLVVACYVALALLGGEYLGSKEAAAAGSGALVAWGRDTQGQLGTPDSTNDAAPNPVAVVGNVIAVAAGSEHSLALKPDGTLFAWGNDTSGELGDGTVGSPSAAGPQVVPGVSGIRAIAAHGRVNFAIRHDGTVLAWGDNSDGLLGNGTVGGVRATPAPVPGLANIVAIAVGDRHALALRADGTVLAWGSDGFGQLGDGVVGAPTIQATPTPVVNLANVKAIAAGAFYSAAVLADGTVRTWGRNESVQLGVGAIDGNLSATPVTPNITGVKGIALGNRHTLALKADGTVFAWGSDASGALGDGTIGGPGGATPTQVPGLADIIAITAGEFYGVAVKADGTALAWGSDSFGHLGDGTVGSPPANPTVAPIPGLDRVTAVVSGGDHTLAIRASNFPVVWGNDSDGQLGDGAIGNPVEDQTPNSIGLANNLKQVAVGGAHTLALQADGTVLAWGSDLFGQLGDGTVGGPLQTARPQVVPGLSGVIAVAAGRNHSLALRADGTVWAWGTDGATAAVATPIEVPGRTPVIAIAAGRGHSLALRMDGTVVAWGDNNGGQLGVGGANQATPVAVPGVALAVAVAAGGSHSLALRASGGAMSWGDDGAGQLGDGTIGSTGGFDPDPVVGLRDAIAIAAGATHSLALRADGSVSSWGADFQGANENSQATPAQVAGLSGVTAITAGVNFSLALRSNGTVAVSGINTQGQLANTAPLGATDVTPNAVGGVTGIAGVGAGASANHVVVVR